MVGLTRRGAAPLLRQVNHKAHARPEDHEDPPYPTPPSTHSTRSLDSVHGAANNVEDVDRDPDSSSEEEHPPRDSSNATNNTRPSFQQPRSAKLDGSADPWRPRGSTFKVRKVNVKALDVATGSKRRTPSSDEDDENDEEIFKQPAPKRQKPGYGKAFKNIHVEVRQKGGFHRDIKTSRQARTKKAVFKQPGGAGILEHHSKSSTAKFRIRDTVLADDARGSSQDSSAFKVRNTSVIPSSATQATDVDDELSDDTSALSSVPDDELCEPGKTICSLCREPVDNLVKEDFEDTVNRDRRQTYKWQRRFCSYHKQRESQVIWDERGYPSIDWDRLEQRLRKHDEHLIQVLNDTVPSHHRKELKRRLKQGPKTVGQRVRRDGGSDEKSNSHVAGYYGPRGEKRMTEYIINNLSSKIRERAASDQLVAAAGVQGGVSGFVQAVLVPHLVELLMREDLHLEGSKWDARAREIVAESAEVGELLHREAEDRVVEVEDEGDSGHEA